VDKKSWADGENVIVSHQFIERTGMDGGGQQIVVGSLEDNPR
jgi:hypothetical protein